MPFDFASAKANARRVVQATFGVQAFYQDASLNAPIEIRARWHDKISKAIGDLTDGSGYAEVIEGIERMVLIPVAHVGGAPVVLKRNGKVTFPTVLPGVTFNLDYKEPASGPLEESWRLTRDPS